MNLSIYCFWKKYWACILLSVIMAVGLVLTELYSHLYSYDIDTLGKFDLSDIYIMRVLPVYSLLYGFFSYLISKKIWVPQLIYFITAYIAYFLQDLSDISFMLFVISFLFSLYPIIFSFFTTIGAALVRKLAITVKEGKDYGIVLTGVLFYFSLWISMIFILSRISYFIITAILIYVCYYIYNIRK